MVKKLFKPGCRGQKKKKRGQVVSMLENKFKSDYGRFNDMVKKEEKSGKADQTETND